MLTSPPTMLVPVRETYLPSSRSGRAMRGNSIRYLVAAIGMLSHALPCVANHCSILEIKFVDYATASCEGTSASSCRTIVPFELPEEICRQQAAMEALHVEHWSQRQELSRRGLTVVYDDQGGREEFALKQSGGRRAGGKPGLHYAVNADIIRLTEWSNILQVQVLYGDVKHNLLSDAPEWHQAGPRHVYPGGHQIKLYVIYCADDNPFPSAEGAMHHEHSASYQDRLMSSLGHPSGEELQSSSREALPDAILPATAKHLRQSSLRQNPHHQVLPFMRHRTQSETTFGGMVHEDGHENVASTTASASSVSSSAQSQHHEGWEQQQGAEACNPFEGGDKWCYDAITTAEREALQVQKMELYCSSECASKGAVWCHIFGKRNCRMCSNDCDLFCQGEAHCACQKCPGAGATEKGACDVGDNKACYEQIGEDDYLALFTTNKFITCDATCLESDEGLWCSAMGIKGCRFCSTNCEDYCTRVRQEQQQQSKDSEDEYSGGRQLDEEEHECECVECPSGITLPIPSSGAASCADETDGDAFCYSQLSEKAAAALEARGMGVECHPTCHPGEVWPVWCYAGEIIGCRYCAESCDDICDKEESECNGCYSCGGRI